MAAYLADHFSKRWAESSLKENGGMRPLLGGRIILNRLSNKGSAGGFFADKTKWVTFGSAAALLTVAVSLVREIRRAGPFLKRIGLALIIGGGAGNLKDRLKKGAVTDFISFRLRNGRKSRLVYNVADLAIFGGLILSAAGELIKGIKDR